jgi:hypothetical protein
MRNLYGFSLAPYDFLCSFTNNSKEGNKGSFVISSSFSWKYYYGFVKNSNELTNTIDRTINWNLFIFYKIIKKNTFKGRKISVNKINGLFLPETISNFYIIDILAKIYIILFW